eukprot:COSAG06_NODE_21184_length_766_cov_2.535232_1_plen_140_part_10
MSWTPTLPTWCDLPPTCHRARTASLTVQLQPVALQMRLIRMMLCSALSIGATQIPTKSTDEHFFDGEWSVNGGRGPVTALKYMNKMTERPFFAAFNPEVSQTVVRKTPSLSLFKLKMIVLSRLARDKHRGKAEKEGASCS